MEEPSAKKTKTASGGSSSSWSSSSSSVPPRYKLVIDDGGAFKKLGQRGGQGAVFRGKSVADPLKEVAVKVFYEGKEAAATEEAVRRPLEGPPVMRRGHR